MKIRTAIVLPDLSSGGAQVMVSRLASHLDPATVEAEVICIFGEERHNHLEQAIADHGVRIHYIKKGKGFSAAAVKRLFKELDRFNPDVVHTHLSACVYCAPWIIAKKRKMLHTIHNMPAHELIKPKRMLMRLLYMTGCAVPVAISKEIQTLTKQFYRLHKDPELIYNPVDVARFAVPKKRDDGMFRILHAGRLSAQKNQQLLIRAFSLLHQKNCNSVLHILGDGPLRQELEESVAQEGLTGSVHFEGNVPNTEDYFAQADLFAMSSVYEGLPLVVLEAMAASLPIVSTDVGGIKDLVVDNGLLTQEGDYRALAEALIWMMEHPSERQEIGQRSYKVVQQYDSSVIASQYTALYNKYSGRRA